MVRVGGGGALNLAQLRELDVRQTGVGQAWLDEFVRTHPECRKVNQQRR
jgi:hypothetical protein